MTIDVTIGHATDTANRTGCSVIRFSEPAPCVADVRGGAPGTRETDLLAPGRLVQRVDAILLTGGSAFGLAAADGVMQRLREEGRGFPTAAGPVPIVPGAVIFDLTFGNPVSPNAEMGYEAAASQTALVDAAWGGVGAGTGATIAKTSTRMSPGGIGYAEIAYDGGSVHAIAVVNALGTPTAPLTTRTRQDMQEHLLRSAPAPRVGENTTLIAVLIDDDIDHDALNQIAVSAHDGLARAIVPAHTPFDGDIVFAASLRPNAISKRISLQSCVATELAVERAIANALPAR
jgi:L-aminopeptidase/D-esterase-like protein